MSHGFTWICTDKTWDFSLDSGIMANASPHLRHPEVTGKIIGVFYDVYNELGHGFLESVYSKAMSIALTQAGLHASREIPVPVWFREEKIGEYFADLLVDNTVLIELKAARTIEPAHEAQLLHYLRATEIEIGLLLNFGLRPQLRRFLFDNDRKKIRGNPCGFVAKVLG